MDVCFELQELNNSIVQIEDTSLYKEETNSLPYNVFAEEDVSVLNILTKVELDSEQVLSVNKEEIKIPSDGWFKITHLVLPTFRWLQSVDEKILKYFNIIYVYSNNDFYKYIDHQLERVNIEEILEINPNSKTTISSSSQEIFNTYYLEECLKRANSQYLYFCKQKNDDCGDSRNCRRNHIWHLLNIIKHYIECGNNLEALRLLNEINSCIDLCKKEEADDCCNVPKQCGCNG